jgi:hypothetical protein
LEGRRNRILVEPGATGKAPEIIARLTGTVQVLNTDAAIGCGLSQQAQNHEREKRHRSEVHGATLAKLYPHGVLPVKLSPDQLLAGSRVAFTHVSKRGTIPLTHIQSDYAEQNDAERRNDNTGNTRCGIVRHSTLWLKPELVGQFEFVEWTSDNHLRHSRFIALRDDKAPETVLREE